MYSKNNNLALKYGFGVDQSQIGPNSNAYTTRMDALSAIPDPVAGAVTNNNKLGTGSDPRFNAASQAANNVSDKGWAQNIDYGTAREAWKESFPEGQMNFLDFAEGLDLPGQGFGQDDQSGQDAGGAGRHGSKAYWDWIDKSKGVGAQTEIHTIGSQHAADASIDAGWGQDYSVDVEAEQLPWYGRLPSGEGSGYDPSKPKPMPYDPNSNQRMMNTQYAQHKGRQLDQARDAAGRNISGEGSYYSAGVHSRTNAAPSGQPGSSDYDPIEAGDLSTTMGGADNLANYGDEYSDFSSKATADKTDYPSYDTGERFSNKDIIAANKDKYLGELDKNNQYDKRETMDDWFRDQDMPEINMEEIMAGKDPQVTDMERRFDAGRDPTDVEIDAMGGGYEKGIGATLGEAWGKFDKTFESIGGGGTAIAAGAKVLGDVLKSSKSQELQEDLRGMKGQVESAVGSLANLKYAEQDAEKERFGEKRRQAAGVENIALSDTLTKIREISQGGLSSGSKSRLIDKATDDSQTKTDIVIADSYDKHLDKMAGIQETSVSERSQLNEKLTEIDRQIADLDHSWMDTALDVGQIVATGMNPAFGMAYAGARTLA